MKERREDVLCNSVGTVPVLRRADGVTICLAEGCQLRKNIAARLLVDQDGVITVGENGEVNLCCVERVVDKKRLTM